MNQTMPIAIRNGPTTTEFLLNPSSTSTAMPPTTNPIEMIQSISGKRRNSHNSQPRPTTISVTGSEASRMSVAPGRPKPLTHPPAGSERSERGGMFHPSGAGPPQATDPPPGGAASEASVGGCFILGIRNEGGIGDHGGDFGPRLSAPRAGRVGYANNAQPSMRAV